MSRLVPATGAAAESAEHKPWERVVGIAVSITAVATIVVVAATHWAEWSNILSDAAPTPLLAAVLVGGIGHFLNTVIAHESLKVSGSPIPLRSVYRIIAVGGLAKFIPGGVWQIGTQYGLGRAEGLGFQRSILAWIEPTAFNVSVGGGMALLAATTVDYRFPKALLVLGALIAFAASTNPVRHRVYRLVRLIPAGEKSPLPMAGWVVRVALTVVVVAGTGLGGMLIVDAFSLAPSPGFLGSLAAFVGAWVVGVLVFPVPGGLGVREGVLVLALSPWMPAHEAVLVATAGRMVAVASELMAAAAGVIIKPGGAARARVEKESKADG